MPYNFKEAEEKFRDVFAKIFSDEDPRQSKKPKFYCLEMFPYPSGRLHMGHVRNYTIGDAIARFKRMLGYNVLYPMGYDSFGLPAENAAIQHSIKPDEWTEKCISDMKQQQISMGNSYNWEREIATHKASYYKWNQYFFIKFFEKGLVYRKKAPVNWCPKCNTVLANEQVHNGKCWRHSDTKVEIRQLEQWFLKTTAYADELLNSLDKLDWPERVKEMQRNWIGKSQGTLIKFKLEEPIASTSYLEVFTTRPDTLYGVTFLVIAPEHPLTLELVKGTSKEEEVKKFIDKVMLEERFERTSEKSKEGIFLGKYAIHPLTQERIPIYTASFVLPDYGTGIVMAVPAHDARDFEFAKQHNLPIKIVIKPKEKHEVFEENAENLDKAFEDYGVLINSDEFNGLTSEQAIKAITKKLEELGLGKSAVQYKMRDWLISRQRYWGTPIPILYCEKCGIVPEAIEKLPVLLPPSSKVEFGKGNPLASAIDWINAKCPKCGGPARRETDTMDTFFDSSWYFLRYIDPKNNNEPFDSEKVNAWMPVDFYIGGIEHATMHLIYARFFTKALRDLGFVNFDEPFIKLVNQGIVTLGGEAMSKSKGNIVDPLAIIPKYGADALRFFILFKAMPDKDLEWSDEGIEAIKNFLDKIADLYEFLEKNRERLNNNAKNEFIIAKLNWLIKEYTKHLSNLEFPYALIKLMDFVKALNRHKEKISAAILELALTNIALLLNPITPYLSEWLWHALGNRGYASLASWPQASESVIKPELLIEDSYIGNIIADINDIKKITKKEKINKITLIIADDWKFKVFELIKSCKTMKEAIEKIKQSKYANRLDELIKILPRFIGKIQVVLDVEKEFKILDRNKDEIEKEFKARVDILLEKEAESFKEKARKAMPLKPAIILD